MKKQLVLFALAMVLAGGQAMAQKGLKNIIVSQEWLQKHSDDKNLVILHVGSSKSYDEGHIAGARYIDADDFSREVGKLRWELPEPEVFKRNLRDRGVNNKTKIVLVHGGRGHAPTFRLYYTLDYYGLGENAVILDGGLKGWMANDLPVTTDIPKNPDASGRLTFKTNASLKVDKDYMKANSLRDDINVIDARRVNFYEGAEETRKHYSRSGHIEGAENICWLDIVDENLFMKDIDTLKAYFEEAGVDKNQEVVAYCHVGLRASVIYTVAKGLGYNTRLYDGSYNEWDILDSSYPVKRGRSGN